MLRFEITVDGVQNAAGAARDLAGRIRRGPRPLLAEIARLWTEEVFPAVLDRGGLPPWEPRSRVTEKLHGPGRPLEGEGILRNSFRILEISETLAVVGNEFGEIHQLGGRTSPNSMIPNREIPARPFLALSEEAISNTLERISVFYFGEIP